MTFRSPSLAQLCVRVEKGPARGAGFLLLGMARRLPSGPVRGVALLLELVDMQPVEDPLGVPVVVLLFVNRVTESTQVSGPRVDVNRVRVTMADTDDGWKISAVDAL
ncbi:hypothetical protein ACF08O_38805 [Streptomyces paradoxus]|uniref:hypothetical protein n=1 Tax=Streptomyces paradoxus TaxID=66375 RepID=UPI0036F7F5D7